MVAGLACFYVLQYAGEKLIHKNDEIEKAAGWSPDIPRELSIEKVIFVHCLTPMITRSPNHSVAHSLARSILDQDLRGEVERGGD